MCVVNTHASIWCLLLFPSLDSAKREIAHGLIFENAKKPWHSYIRSALHLNIVNNLLGLLGPQTPLRIETLLSNQRLAVMQFLQISRSEDNGNSVKRFSVPLLENKKLIYTQLSSQVVKKPTGYNVLRDMRLHRKVRVFHHWQYHLHRHLRLNVSVVQFNVTFGDAHECQLGNITFFPMFLAASGHMEYTGTSESSYCGTLPNYFLCPKSHKVSVVLQTEILTTYDVKFAYSVIESNLTFTNITYTISNGRSMLSWYSFIYVKYLHATISYIYVKKFEKILVTLTLAKNIIVNVHDGPGTSLPRLKSLISFPKNITVYETSAFSCVILIHNMSHLIRATYKTRVVETHVQVIPDKSSNFVYPNPLCNQHSPVCVVQIISQNTTHVNISTEKISYSGQDNKFCNFAGLTAHDNKEGKENLREIVPTICSDFHLKQYKYRPIYSKTNSMLLVFHCYSEFGRMNMSFIISKTFCKAITINACFINTFVLALGIKSEFLSAEAKSVLHAGQISVPEGICVIVQLTNSVRKHFKHFIQETSLACRYELKPIDIPEPGKIMKFSVSGFLHGVLLFIEQLLPD